MTKALFQRGNGALEIGFKAADGATRLAHLFQSDPCRALFPRSEADDIGQSILITTSGGLAGGDRLRLSIDMQAGTRQQIATQAAEKIYGAEAEPTRIDVSVTVADGAWLEWLPQETILFQNARLSRTVNLAIRGGGELLTGDILAFGRAARGEKYADGLLHDRWRLSIDDKLIWADQMRLDAPNADLAHPAGFDGAGASGMILFRGRAAPALLPLVREHLEAHPIRAGASLVAGVLLIRMLGPGALPLREAFADLWSLIRAEAAGLPSRMPRIWHT